jgi:hypothetical protein
MKERPILFSKPMVQALLEGRKTQTRRLIKPDPDIAGHWKEWTSDRIDQWIRMCPYGVVGDYLWVRELHWRWGKWIKNGLTKSGRTKWTFFSVGNSVRYAENAPKTTAKRDGECGWVYRHARFMFHAHSRIKLEITNVRVERLQDISEEDAVAEGIESIQGGTHLWINYSIRRDESDWFRSPIDSYRSLWESINGVGSWDENPFVWKLKLKKV